MIADEMLGRDYDYTVKGGKEERISAKTNQSQIAKFLGSKTIETKRNSDDQYADEQRTERLTKKMQVQIQNALNAQANNKPFDISHTINLGKKLDKTPKEIYSMFISASKDRMIDRDMRFKYGKDGSISLKEMQRAIRLDEGKE